MNKKLRFFVLALIIIFGGVLGFINQENISNYITTRSFLGEVKLGNFERAFNYVDYYDIGDDLKPKTSYEKAKDIWTSRLIKLKQDDIYLRDYKNLIVYMDDGYPSGKVILLIYNKGIIEEQECLIHFSKLAGKWKIEDLYFNNSDHVFKKAVSGNVNIE